MGNYSELKDLINNPTSHGLPEWDNGDNRIEGEMMKSYLLAIVNSLSSGGYLFADVAKLTPTQTDPGTPDQNVFYIAAEPGTYTNFPISGGYLQVADDEVAIFKFNGTWSKEVTGAATAAKLTELGQEVIFKEYLPIVEDDVYDDSYLAFSPSSNRGNVGTISGMKVYVYAVTAGDKIKLIINNAVGSSLSWGLYSATPLSHDTLVSFGPKSSGADGTHIIDVNANGYLAFTKEESASYQISKETEIPIKEVVEQNSEDIELIKEQIDNIPTPPYRYLIASDAIKIAYGYGDKDIVVSMQKKGGNNLFDFLQLSTIQKGGVIGTAAETTIVFISTDWHAPFVVAAKDNINGDNIDSQTGQYYKYFTGGNHQYNNTGSGSTATARCQDIEFYINGNKVSQGSGEATSIEIRWTNFVQGYNTTKADGTGREILKEVHRLVFAPDSIIEDVELIPLEDIEIETWYGFQYSGRATADPQVLGPYAYTRFVGATNKKSQLGVFTSGQKLTTDIIGENTDRIRVNVDPTCDLGSRYCLTDADNGAFTSGGNKAYFNIVTNRDMDEGEHYYLKGGWEFSPL